MVPVSTPPDVLAKSLKSEVRNRIRRGLKSGIKVHWVFAPTFGAEYEALLESTYGRQGSRRTFR